MIEGQPKGNSRALEDSEVIKAMTAHTTELGHLKAEAQVGLTTFQAVPQPVPRNEAKRTACEGDRATGAGTPCACLASTVPT